MPKKRSVLLWGLLSGMAVAAGLIYGFVHSGKESGYKVTRMKMTLGAVREIELPVDTPRGVVRSRLLWNDPVWYLQAPPLHLASGHRVDKLIDTFVNSKVLVSDLHVKSPDTRFAWVFHGDSGTVKVYPDEGRCPKGMIPCSIDVGAGPRRACISRFRPVPVALAWILESHLVPDIDISTLHVTGYDEQAVAGQSGQHDPNGGDHHQVDKFLVRRAGRCVLDGAMTDGVACMQWLSAWKSLRIVKPRPNLPLTRTLEVSFGTWRLMLGLVDGRTPGARRGQEGITVTTGPGPWKLVKSMDSLLSRQPFAGPIPSLVQRYWPWGTERVEVKDRPYITHPHDVPYASDQVMAALAVMSAMTGTWMRDRPSNNATDMTFEPAMTVRVSWADGLGVSYPFDSVHCILGYPDGRRLRLSEPHCRLLSLAWASRRPLGWPLSSLEGLKCGQMRAYVKKDFIVVHSEDGHKRIVDLPDLPENMMPLRYGTLKEGIRVKVSGPGTASTVTISGSRCQVGGVGVIYECRILSSLVEQVCGSPEHVPNKEMGLRNSVPKSRHLSN